MSDQTLFRIPAGAIVAGQELASPKDMLPCSVVIGSMHYGPDIFELQTPEWLAGLGIIPTPIDEYPEPSADELAAAADAAILAQIAAIEAMQTPRLLREAALNKDCTVSKPGCCINGMTPAAALAAMDAECDALRAQLVNPVYYQVK